jgi:hypothetical protein
MLDNSALEALAADCSPSDEERDDMRPLLALAIKGLYELGYHSQMELTIFRVIRLQIYGDNSRLLQDISESAADDESIIAQRELHIESQYPVNIVGIAENPKNQGVSNLVAAYKDLGLQDFTSPSQED